MQSLRYFLMVTLALACCCTQSRAAVVDSGHVKAELVSEVDAIVPGESFYVLLRQEIAPGWHTYWRNPGDSGAETTLAWDLPEGFAAGDIEWPYPERIPYGPLVNYGYHGEVLFPVEITAPADLERDEVVLRTLGEWLVCEDICIPEEGTLELVLPVRDEASKVNTDIFAKARSKIPRDIGVESSYEVVGDEIVLSLEMESLVAERIESITFFPYTLDLIENGPRQVPEFTRAGIDLSLMPGFDFVPGADLSGIVVVKERGGAGDAILTTAFTISPSTAGGPPPAPQESGLGIVTAVLFALLGGLILNLMPCVFPVLSIKVLSLMQHAGGEVVLMRKHGWVYAAGVVLSFVAIALVLIGLRAGGAQIGWGFQLQSPVIVALLAYLFVLIGLNLFGLFEIGTSLMRLGSGQEGHSYPASFVTGVLATIVAAPCTVPFMASAVGFALTRDNATAIAIFGALGAGMAAPYVLLCHAPGLLARLPRPGAWMERVKEALAFPMFASAIWLVWVLSQQAGSDGVLYVLAGMLMLTISIWCVQHLPTRLAARYLVIFIALILGVAALSLPFGFGQISHANIGGNGERQAATPASGYDGPVWETWSPEALAAARAQGPVFVNFTAAWCITCKVNERVALDSRAVREAFEAKRVQYLKGDWTNEDPVITGALAEYERSGVPLYLLYRPGSERAVVLPQVLTESIVLRAVESL